MISIPLLWGLVLSELFSGIDWHIKQGMSGFPLPVGLCTLLSNHQVIHISVNFRCIPQPSTTSWGLASPAWCLLGACCSRRVVVHGRLAPKAHRVTCMTRMVFSTFLYRAFTARIGEDIDG